MYLFARSAFKRSIVAAITVATLSASCVLQAEGAFAGTPGLVIPPTGTLLGAAIQATSPSGFTSFESLIGRKLDYLRLYYNWDTPQPDGTLEWAADNSRIPLLSIQPAHANGTKIPWTSIANGSQDTAITAQAEAFASLGTPLLLSFNHEPETSPDGTPADFVAAWQHYVTVFRDLGVTNVQFVLILDASSYTSGLANQYYPGDSYVDWVGADGYNYNYCRPKATHETGWRGFQQIFSGLNQFGIAHNKPVAVAEWASVEDPNQAGRKAQWISDAAATLKSWPQVKAASYFDSAGPQTTCQWLVTSSASALAAFATMALDPAFNPRPHALLTAPTTAGATPLTVAFDGSGTTGLSSPIASWILDPGDGSLPVVGTGMPPSVIDHTYTTSGTYTATLTVVDGNGQSDFSLLSGIAADPPPVVLNDAGTATSPSTAALTGSLNPDGLDTTYTFDYGTTTAYGSSTPVADAGSSNVATDVAASLSGLSPGVTYHFALVATNGSGTATSADKTFLTPSAPGVSTGTATALSQTSATVNGTVTPHKLDSTWYFEWGPTAAFGSSGPVPNPVVPATASRTDVNLGLTGLSPGTTYYYRLDAYNAAGTTLGVTRTFVTSGAPVVLNDAGTATSPSTAALTGSLNPDGLDTTYTFDYGTTTAYGSSTPVADAGSSNVATDVAASLSGLSPGVTYHFALVATNGSGTATSADKTFLTPSAPGVSTGTATALSQTSATVNGTVTPHKLDSTWYFEWGPTAAFGSSGPVPNPVVPATASRTDVNLGLTGLSPGTTYYYRLDAYNAAGTTLGVTRTFVTSGAPVATTGYVGTRTIAVTTVHGSVLPDGLDTLWYYEFGTSVIYGSVAPVPSGNAGGGTKRATVSANFTDLLPGVTYHFALVANNDGGHSVGTDTTFKVPKQ